MNITALTIVYKTPDLIKKAYESFRIFYPDIPLVIVNNSGQDDPCTVYIDYLDSIDNELTIINNKKNEGHGTSFNQGMDIIKTDYVYYFDSDVIMFKGDVLEEMLNLINENIYGIGKMIYTDMGGRNIPNNYEGEKLKFFYCVAGLINRNMYYKFHRWTRFGLIAYKAMVEIHNKGLSEKILKEFPILSYVRHLSGGTRSRFGDCEDLLDDFKNKKRRKGVMTDDLD